MDPLPDDVKKKLTELVEDDLKFVDKPKNLLCSNCGRIPLFHYIYPCSHPYCRVCYVNVFQKQKMKCRVCSNEIGIEMLQSQDLEIAIYKLKAICPNRVFVCEDKIELHVLVKHLAECKYTKENQFPKLYNEKADFKEEGTPADNDLKLSIKNIRETINGLTMTVQNLAEQEEQLQKKQNENDSKEQPSLVRKDLDLVTQQVQLLKDTVASIEQNIEKQVEDLNRIETNQKTQTLNIVEKFTSDYKQLEKKHDELKKKMDTFAYWMEVKRQKSLKKLKFSEFSQEEIEDVTDDIRKWKNGTVLCQIKNYADNIIEKATVSSDPFYLNDGEYKLRLDLEFGSTGLVCKIKFRTTDSDGILQFGFHYRATISILDQSDTGSDKTDWMRMWEPHFGSNVQKWMDENLGFTIADFSDLEETDIRAKYVKDDTIFVKVQVEPLSLLFGNYFSRNGMLTFAVDNYVRVKRDSQRGINKFFRSDYFYSSAEGYRLKARLWWRNEAVLFILAFLVGENDDQLPSTYSHRCTVVVVNQKDDGGENDLPVEAESFEILNYTAIEAEEYQKQMASRHCYGICSSQSNFEKEPFLSNDKMIFKVIIEIL